MILVMLIFLTISTVTYHMGYFKGEFSLAARFDLDSIQFHRNLIRSPWILSALTKLLTAHDFVTSRPAYVSREFAVSVLPHRAMMFDLLLLTSLLLRI